MENPPGGWGGPPLGVKAHPGILITMLLASGKILSAAGRQQKVFAAAARPEDLFHRRAAAKSRIYIRIGSAGKHKKMNDNVFSFACMVPAAQIEVHTRFQIPSGDVQLNRNSAWWGFEGAQHGLRSCERPLGCSDAAAHTADPRIPHARPGRQGCEGKELLLSREPMEINCQGNECVPHLRPAEILDSHYLLLSNTVIYIN